MTKGEAPTAADQGQAPADSAATQNSAAAAATAEQMASTAQEAAGNAPLNAAEQAALAAAAAEAGDTAEGESPVQLASAAEAQASVKADAAFDPDKKKEDEEAEAEEAPVDLAYDSDAQIIDAIAAADGARAVSGEDGEEASAFGGDGDGSGVALGVAAALAVGAGVAIAVGGDDDKELAPPPPPPPPPPPNVAPEFTSGTAADVDENAPADTVVYTATATDADGDDITFSIDAEGDDADAFTIDPETGEVRFVASPDFEMQESYTITVVATDSEGNATTQDVVISVNDVAENEAPEITSEATVDVDENIDADTVVLDVEATDPDGDDVTFSIDAESDDAAAFTIDPATGEVRFVTSPDFESQESYSITVVATDSEGNATTQDVTINVNDIDPENAAPEFTSDATVDVPEDTDIADPVYTVTATDPDGDDITFELGGEDAALFTFDETTGELRFVDQPDFEADAEYTVTFTATDSEGNVTTQDVVINVTDVDEPTAVDLDAADNDGNPNTPNLVSAAGDDFLFTDDAAEGSFTIITGFGEGDLIEFSEGAEISFSTGPDDANDLQIIVNDGGTVSEIILDDVLADDAGFIFNEATAEAAVGFDFISTAEPAAPVATIEETFA